MVRYLTRSCPMCGLPGNNGNQHAIFRCKLSTGVVYSAAIDSPGYSCKAERPLLFAPPLLVVDIRLTSAGLAMLQSVIILVFTALASSFLWWRGRFKLCRRFLSSIRHWPSVCHVCGAEQ